MTTGAIFPNDPPATNKRIGESQYSAPIFDKRELTHPTVIVPVVGRGHGYPIALHEGSIIREWYPGYPEPQVANGKLRPALDWADERLVSYIDDQGTMRFGHVRAGTILRRPRFQTADYTSIAWSGSDGTRLPVVDLLRERIALARSSTVAYVNRHKNATHRALYQAVVRERGGNADPNDVPTLLDRLMRLVLSPEARQMATKDEAETEDGGTATATRKGKKGSKKGGKKTAAKRESNGEARASMGVGLGEKLVTMFKKAGVKGAPVVTAKSLAAGETPKKSVLITLRDAINEAAGGLRGEDGDPGLASQLSAANRVVRRLSRA